MSATPADPPMGVVDPSAPAPLYHQVEVALRDRIRSGAWAPGMQIPTEDQLCEQFRVSRVTVRHALRNLVDQGLLVRERGRGTFVRDTTMTSGARGLTSFTAEMQAIGLTPGARVLAVSEAPAEADVAEALDVLAGTPVVSVRRLRTGDGEPVGVQTAHLPAARVPGLANRSLADRSLYALLREEYGITPVEAIETVRVTVVDTDHARLLGVPEGSCAFAVERVTFDAHGPYEVVHSVMRGDRYRIRLVLRNP